MQIISLPFINNISTPQKKSPSFQKLDKFTQIKQIPDLICACCGKKLLSADKYASSITPLSKPLEYSIRKGKFNYLKNLLPKSWDLIKNFTYKYPNASLDEIIEKKNEYIALKITIAETMDDPEIINNTPERFALDKKISKTFFKILENGRCYMKEAPMVIEKLAPYKSLLTDYKKDVFETFENYAKIYPDKTLYQIIQETHSIHETKATEFKEKTLKLIKERLANIKQIVKDKPQILEQINEKEQEIIEIIYQDYSIPTRNDKIKKIYNKILKKNNSACFFHQIMNEIKQLPESVFNVDTFIANAYKYNHSDAKVIINLYIDSISSEQCIVPLKENGKNKVGNKIVLCNGCVREKVDIPYNLFINIHPEMIENMQKQMDIITNEILKKNLIGNFRFYPLLIAHKFKEFSQGKINLNLTRYAEEIKKDSLKNIQDLEEKIKEIENDINEKIEFIDKFPTLRRDFMERINVLNSKIHNIREQITIEQDLLQKIENYLKEFKIKK